MRCDAVRCGDGETERAGLSRGVPKGVPEGFGKRRGRCSLSVGLATSRGENSCQLTNVKVQRVERGETLLLHPAAMTSCTLVAGQRRRMRDSERGSERREEKVAVSGVEGLGTGRRFWEVWVWDGAACCSGGPRRFKCRKSTPGESIQYAHTLLHTLRSTLLPNVRTAERRGGRGSRASSRGLGRAKEAQTPVLRARWSGCGCWMAQCGTQLHRRGRGGHDGHGQGHGQAQAQAQDGSRWSLGGGG
ncbi:hypothetical protein B0J11DRAFT_37107 [Dendryphion nanum]|uniref:Uncharacterized protein n=1 Tax=Dendryphion nanum TaxID=256645 RepID=A0A9P9EKL4_9PLEO|nr:hypothetical protein B0J11DRAFT_37107 [Dendryphion nanum]